MYDRHSVDLWAAGSELLVFLDKLPDFLSMSGVLQSEVTLTVLYLLLSWLCFSLSCSLLSWSGTLFCRFSPFSNNSFTAPSSQSCTAHALFVSAHDTVKKDVINSGVRVCVRPCPPGSPPPWGSPPVWLPPPGAPARSVLRCSTAPAPWPTPPSDTHTCRQGREDH